MPNKTRLIREIINLKKQIKLYKKDDINNPIIAMLKDKLQTCQDDLNNLKGLKQ